MSGIVRERTQLQRGVIYWTPTGRRCQLLRYANREGRQCGEFVYLGIDGKTFEDHFTLSAACYRLLTRAS